jgi:iron(III) transport system substrate-binding protein
MDDKTWQRSEGGLWQRGISRRNMLRGISFLGAGLGAAALIGCGSSGESNSTSTTSRGSGATASPIETRLYEAAKQEGKVVWWSTINIDDAQAYIKEFEKTYSGVKIEYFEASADVVLEKVLAETQAGRQTADVFNTNSYGPVRAAGIAADLGELIEPPTYPADLFQIDKAGAYYQYTVYTMAYNTNRVKANEAPKTYDDLLNARWKNRIALERRLIGFVGGTEIPAFEGKVKDLWTEQKMVDYLTKLKDNGPRLEQGNTVIMTKLVAGEYDVGQVLMHQVFEQQKNGAPVDIAPMDRAFVLPGSAYVHNKSTHPNAARLFMRWWIGPEGNRIADQQRPTGNPLPGTGTTPAKALEAKASKPILTPINQYDDFDRLVTRYQQALGAPSR